MLYEVRKEANITQYHCAINKDCNILTTNNPYDFKESEIPLRTPDEYLISLKGE
jgi:hypothetical protein